MLSTFLKSHNFYPDEGFSKSSTSINSTSDYSCVHSKATWSVTLDEKQNKGFLLSASSTSTQELPPSFTNNSLEPSNTNFQSTHYVSKTEIWFIMSCRKTHFQPLIFAHYQETPTVVTRTIINFNSVDKVCYKQCYIWM